MKKRQTVLVTIGMIIVFSIILGIVYHFRDRRTYALNLPEIEKIECISINANENLSTSYCKEETMKKIIDNIAGVKRITKEESVQDYPINASDIITVEFYLKEQGSSLLYLYKRNNKFYIEQPYNGIYKISEDDYKSINHYTEVTYQERDIMSFDLDHKVSTLSKLVLQTKRKRDKNNKLNIKVYELWMDHTYRTYETVQKQGYKSYQFQGEKVNNREFDTILPSVHKTKKDKPIGDVFSVEVSSVCLNEKAYKVLKPYLEKHCQIFEILSQDEKIFIVNVTDMIDCLDYDKSEIKRFPSSGRVMRVMKYVFKIEKLMDAIIFKLPEFPKSISYVTEEFKNVVEENDIKGF